VRLFVEAHASIKDIDAARQHANVPLQRCLRNYIWYITGSDPGPVPKVCPILLLGLGVSALARL
jgi:hypothetical protein